MKTPSSDGIRNGPGPAGTTPPKPMPAGTGPAAGAVPETRSPDPLKPEPGTAGVEAGKVEVGKSEAGKSESATASPPKPAASTGGSASAPGTSTPASASGPTGSREPVKDASSSIKPGMPGAAKAEPLKPDAMKTVLRTPDPAKPEPVKSEPVKPDLGGLESGRLESGRLDASKATGPSIGRIDPIRPEASKPEPSKPEASKTDPIKAERADPIKADPVKSEASKPAGTGPQAVPRGTGAPADGPIIDLKARRIPDAAEAARRDGPETSAASGPSVPPKGPAATGPAPGAAPSRGPGFGAMAAASLLGGVIGAGLLLAVERSGVLPSAPNDLDSRLAALDQKVGTLAPKDAVASLDKRVSTNEAALKPLPDAVRGAEATAREALQKAAQTPAVAQAPAAIQAPAAPGDGAASVAVAALPADLTARLDSLDQRIAALQEEPGREQPADANKVGAGLDERLKAVEAKVESAAKPTGPADLDARLAAFQSEIKANADTDQTIGQKLAALQQSLDERVKSATEAVQTATEASRQAVDANKAQAGESAKAVDRQIQAQADRIAGLDKAIAERAETATVRAALRVVFADRIATALATGAPYADALNALRNLQPGDPARLNAVAVFADAGAPSARALAAEFRTIAERAAASRKVAQARSVAETGDIGQRLMSMADSIVQVRRVDAPAADKASTADPLAEVQAALDRGAVVQAAKAFAAVPEPSRAEAGEFGTKLASRAAAGEAAQGLLSDAFQGLSIKDLSTPAATR